jgi:leader peptidase (prepilin peptidase)/N-methyltransferase
VRGIEMLVVALTAAVGAGTGVLLRHLLRRLRRGVVLPAGPTEAAGAVVAGVSVGVAWGRPTLALILLAGLLLVALSGVDLVHHRLPDAITLPALPAAALAVIGTYLLAPQSGSALRSVVSAAVLWTGFALLARLQPAWMGRGDVKLIPTLGLLLGYVSSSSVVLGLAVAFGSGSLVSLAAVAAGRLRMRSAIPLGPYLLFGTWVVLLLGVGRL